MPQKIKYLIAGLSGNVLEWYEFGLYAFFASLIAKLFFPNQHPFVALIYTFGIFAAGFFARPIGALIFGHIGDKFGRRKMLLRSIWLMAIPTFGIGLLPTFQTAGNLAAILLLILRICQGIAVGGEMPAAMVFLSEHAKNHPALASSGTFFASFVGTLLASLVSAICFSFFTQAQLLQGAWRLPFLSSLIFFIPVIIWRHQIQETQSFQDFQAQHLIIENPIRSSLKHDYLKILRALGFIWLGAVGICIIFIYLPTYFRQYTHVSKDFFQWLNTYSISLMAIACLGFGWLGDKIGIHKIIFAGTVLTILMASFIFKIIHSENLTAIFFAITAMTLALAAYTGPSAIYLVKMFHSNLRCSGLSLAYNLGLSLFGGTVPIVATLIIYHSKNPLNLSYYLILSGFVTLLAQLKFDTQKLSDKKVLITRNY